MTLPLPPADTTRLPGPPRRWWGLPLLHAMRRDPLVSAEALQRRYGDFCAMRIGGEQVVQLSSPALVREALVEHADDLERWERGRAVFAEAFGNGILVSEGARWQRQRRMLQPGFAPRRVAGYGALMVAAARRALDEALPPGATQAEVDLDALFTQLTMDVILRTLFGQGTRGDAREAARAVQWLSEAALREMLRPWRTPAWLPSPRAQRKRRALATLRALVGGQIAARRALPPAQAPQDDLLAMLLAARDEVDGSALDEAEVFDQSMVLFQAGHETSATGLLWWAALLARDADAAECAHAEVDAVLGGRDPVADDLPRLPWLVATLKEAMRLYPPVPLLMGRRVQRSFVVGGQAVAAGTLLRISPWVIQRDARWFDAPLDFRPPRFLPDAPPPPRGAWLPFGTGPRVCIGQHFAMLEMTLVAALLLQRWRLDAGARPFPRARTGVTLRPVGGLPMRLVRR